MSQANRSTSATDSETNVRPAAPGRRGRRPALEADERRRLAAVIARMVLVEGREQKEVLQHLKRSEPELPHLDASTVSRLYRYALDTGIVRVFIDERAPFQPPREETLERELVVAYGLQSAIVAEIPPTPENGGAMLADDAVQRVLGQVAAVYLDTIFRQNEVIGLSSGRAVFHTCESLFESHIFDKRNLRGIRVMSLNGSITATPWSVQSPNARVAMDADASASWLARAFADVAQVRLSLPAALATPADVASSLLHGPGMMISPQLWEKCVRSQPALAPVSDYEVVVPTLGLVGVGAAHPDSGHRYITGCGEPHLEPVREHMVRLIEIARAIHKQYPDIGCAVGDMCNRLFVTLAAQRNLPDRLFAELERCVAEINCRLVSVSFEQLQMIPKVVAVSGGKTKVEAIRSVLEWNKMGWQQPLVHDLVTDSQTASQLIQAKHVNRW